MNHKWFVRVHLRTNDVSVVKFLGGYPALTTHILHSFKVNNQFFNHNSSQVNITLLANTDNRENKNYTDV